MHTYKLYVCYVILVIFIAASQWREKGYKEGLQYNVGLGKSQELEHFEGK